MPWWKMRFLKSRRDIEWWDAVKSVFDEHGLFCLLSRKGLALIKLKMLEEEMREEYRSTGKVTIPEVGDFIEAVKQKERIERGD